MLPEMGRGWGPTLLVLLSTPLSEPQMQGLRGIPTPTPPPALYLTQSLFMWGSQAMCLSPDPSMIPGQRLNMCYNMEPKTKRHFGSSPACLQTKKAEAGGQL